MWSLVEALIRMNLAKHQKKIMQDIYFHQKMIDICAAFVNS